METLLPVWEGTSQARSWPLGQLPPSSSAKQRMQRSSETARHKDKGITGTPIPAHALPSSYLMCGKWECGNTRNSLRNIWRWPGGFCRGKWWQHDDKCQVSQRPGTASPCSDLGLHQMQNGDFPWQCCNGMVLPETSTLRCFSF